MEDPAELKLLLAKPWPVDHDPTGWWMSEKLDGVRAYWTGERFLSRNGNPFDAPAWFTSGLPAFALDGELWAGRGKFQTAVSIARTQGAHDDWTGLDYVVFDAPDAPGPFEERLSAASVSGRVMPQVRCEGIEDLRTRLHNVEARGGEGLMLRQPGSLYERKRSGTLLKVKTFHDAEARVVGHAAGKGKHSGRLGALECELANGVRFSVGTGFSDAQREAPPSVGSLVTYRFQELTLDGVPRFPSFVRACPEGL